eukprot:TRINITY_DN5433_c0_g1_i2.p1 TRINITY_DN5433_c0_g1~~TRINITY_DN5433_c0_g1_i2.p1  ORF type:complete len:257 (-),score=68.01 TRINITY_DN5433_c0_g1_i2:168-938(-)
MLRGVLRGLSVARPVQRIWHTHITSKLTSRNYAKPAGIDAHMQPDSDTAADYRLLKRLVAVVAGLSLGKGLYDGYISYTNYSMLKEHDRLKSIWNSAGLDSFIFASRDKDVVAALGGPVKMGPPPMQSTSPLYVSAMEYKIKPFAMGNFTHAPNIQALAAQGGSSSAILPAAPSSSSYPNTFFTVRSPAGVSVVDFRLPLVGSKCKGTLYVTVYTEKGEWKTKHVRVVSEPVPPIGQPAVFEKDLIHDVKVAGLQS